MAVGVEGKINDIIANTINVELKKVLPEADFVKDLGLDHINIADVISAIEFEYDIEISDEDARKLKKLKQTVDYVKEKI
jgi:acyl carrier protein